MCLLYSSDRRRRHSVSLEEKPNVSEHEESLEKVKDSSLPPLTFLQSDDQVEAYTGLWVGKPKYILCCFFRSFDLIECSASVV